MSFNVGCRVPLVPVYGFTLGDTLQLLLYEESGEKEIPKNWGTFRASKARVQGRGTFGGLSH